MTYDEAMAYIASLEQRGWRLGLDRMQEFVRRAGLLDSVGGPGGPQFIHVAGTNGKGSTTAYLQSMLVESGYRTGAFFSPYVVDPRERVQYGHELISKEDVAALVKELIPPGESLTQTTFGGVTEFELKTALGFLYWKKRECEWVALEVGLGGRLDATNVVTPRATVIVSISYDHMSILGDTITAIAYEKAGIIKPGVPCIVGALPPDAMRVVEAQASEMGAPVWRFGREVVWDAGSVSTPRRTHTGICPGIRGSRQEINVSLALAAMDASGAAIDEEALRLGATRATVPGRFQEKRIDGKIVVFDGAHNAESARVLRESLDEHYPGKNTVLVTNMLLGHEVGDFYEPLKARSAHVVPIDFHRARPVEQTARDMRAWIPTVIAHQAAKNGLQAALDEATENDIVVVTGSFYLVGDLLRTFT